MSEQETPAPKGQVKIDALVRGFVAAGEADADIPRLVEEHFGTARLVDDGAGGTKAEIRLPSGGYADPKTAKHLASRPPKTDAEIRKGMAEWVKSREAGAVDPKAAKPGPEPAAPKEETQAEQTARVINEWNAGGNPGPKPKTVEEAATKEGTEAYMAARRKERHENPHKRVHRIR